MKNILLFFACMLFANCYSQLYVKASTDVFVEDDGILYTNEDFTNLGVVTLNNDSRFVFDGNFTNDNIFNYENGLNKGILVIGSGDASRSNDNISIQFHPSIVEEAPFIELNKFSTSTATITRGLMRLQETLTSTSGVLDANSSITDTPSVNTVTGLTFISNATNTAVVNESSGGSVQNVLVECYIPANQRAFRAFSSSVTTTGSISDNLMEGGQITTAGTIDDPRPGFGMHITGSATVSDGFDITQTNNPSMFNYTSPNTGNYSAIPNTSGTMSAGESFLVLIRGGRDFALTGNNLVGPDTRLRMLGDLQIGSRDASFNSIMPTLASGGGTEYFASIGNPYQAQVDLGQVLTDGLTTGLDDTTVYIFDPTINAPFGDWVTLNFGLTGVDWVLQSKVPAGSAMTQYLQPNQAFYAVKNETTDALEVRFSEIDKKSTDPTLIVGIFSEENAVTDLSVSLDLVEIGENNLRGGVLIQFNDSYSDTYIQAEDAISFTSFTETMSSVSAGGINMSFDKRNIDTNGEIVQLNIENFTETHYKFNISIENNDNQYDVYLIDNYLNTQTLIDADTFVHNFNVDSSIPASIDLDRFELGVNNTTLSSNTFELNGIGVYPNPVVDMANVDLAQFAGKVKTVNVYDITGKVVKTQEITETSNLLQVDMNSLSSGVYILQLDTDSGQYQQKLIKE